LTIYIEQNQPFSGPIRWVFDGIAANKQVVFEYVNTAKNTDFVVSKFSDSDVYLDFDFYRKIDNQNFDLSMDSNLSKVLNSPKIEGKTKGKTDFFAPIFYLTNCLQEYGSTALNVTNFRQVGKPKRA
jgi:hypothetical protein